MTSNSLTYYGREGIRSATRNKVFSSIGTERTVRGEKIKEVKK